MIAGKNILKSQADGEDCIKHFFQIIIICFRWCENQESNEEIRTTASLESYQNIALGYKSVNIYKNNINSAKWDKAQRSC